MRILINDCFAFDFIKKDESPNINKFMNKLIPNLLVLRKNRREIIHKELSSTLEFESNNKFQEKIRQHMDTLFDKIYFSDAEFDNLSETIWIRPKEENMVAFDEIIESELQICQIDLSNYLRSLLNEYAKLQQHNREIILFYNEMDIIKQSIENDNVVNLKYKGQKYSVVMINYYSEFLYDQSNYIISYDIKNNHIKSMPLCKIEKIYKLQRKLTLSENVFATYHKVCEDFSFNKQDTFEVEGVQNEIK